MNFAIVRVNLLVLNTFCVLLIFVQTTRTCFGAELVDVSQSEVPPIEEDQIIDGATICSHHFGADEITRLTQAGLKIGSGSKSRCLVLREGNVLLNADVKVTVVTPTNVIIVGSQASVFIMVTKENVSVLDLSQPNNSEVSVVISADKKTINMQPGKLLFITSKDASDLTRMQVDRNLIPFMHIQNITSGRDSPKAYMANFSVIEALMVIEPLRRMALSHHKNDNIVMEKLVSSAILLEDLSNPLVAKDGGR